MTMSTAYARCVAVEEQAWPLFAEWLRLVSDDGTFERVPNRPGDYDVQRFGDAWASVDGARQSFELKVEAEDRFGNFYLESWSNKRTSRRGWLYTCRADWLCYLFLEPAPVLYCFDLLAVKAWCFTEGVERFPERKQGRHEQGNETWGWCVPIETLIAEVERTPRIWTRRQGQWV